MFWRSRHDNTVNEFYLGEADGCIRQAPWIVFWYGIDDLDVIRGCAGHCRERGVTLEDVAA